MLERETEGCAFSEQGNWRTEFQGAISLPKGAGHINVVLIRAVTIYLEPLILWVCSKLPKTVF